MKETSVPDQQRRMELNAAEELSGSKRSTRKSARQIAGTVDRVRETRAEIALRFLRIVLSRSRAAARKDNSAVTGPWTAG